MSQEKIKKYKNHIAIYLPPYNQEVFITNDKDELLKKVKSLGWSETEVIDNIHENINNKATGITTLPEYDNENVSVICVYFKADRYGTLHHEIIHATMFLLKRIGVKIEHDNHEILCYLSTFLFQTAFHHFFINKEKKTKGKNRND